MKTIIYSLTFAIIGILGFTYTTFAASTVQIRSQNVTKNATSYASTISSEPADVIRVRVIFIGDNESSTSFKVSIPSDITYAGNVTKLIGNNITVSESGNDITFSFAASTAQSFTFNLILAGGSTFGTNHILSIPLYKNNSTTESNSTTIVVAPIITSIAPAQASYVNAQLLTIKGHGFTSVSEISKITLIKDQIEVELEITDIAVQGPDPDNHYLISGHVGSSLKVPALTALGSYHIILEVKRMVNNVKLVMQNRANESETVLYTALETDPALISNPISNLSAKEIKQTNFKLNWNSSNTTQGFDTYKIVYSTSPGVIQGSGTTILKSSSGYGALGSVGTNSITITNLNANKNYYFIMFACNTDKVCSESSPELTVKTLENKAVILIDDSDPVVQNVGSGGAGGGSSNNTDNTSTPSTNNNESLSGAGSVLGTSIGVYPNGTLLKAKNINNVWYISENNRHLIPSAKVFNTRFNWDDIIELPSNNQIELYPTGSAITFRANTLIKEAGNSTVYRISQNGGKSAFISSKIFHLRGHSFKNVLEVTQGALSAYLVEPLIDNAQILLDGDLVKLTNNPAVYLFENGKLRIFKSYDIFQEHAYKLRDVRIITQENFNALAIGKEMNYPDGTLVRYDTPNVYVISDQKRRPIYSEEVFEALLYKWSKVEIVNGTVTTKLDIAELLRLAQIKFNIVGL